MTMFLLYQDTGKPEILVCVLDLYISCTRPSMKNKCLLRVHYMSYIHFGQIFEHTTEIPARNSMQSTRLSRAQVSVRDLAQVCDIQKLHAI